MILKYKDLAAWSKSVDLACGCYRISSGFPRSERYGITVQLREAAVSVAANIAEGHGRRAPRDFHRFLDISYGSLNEVQTYLHLAIQLNFCSPDEAAPLFDLSNEVGRIINGLQRSLRRGSARVQRDP